MTRPGDNSGAAAQQRDAFLDRLLQATRGTGTVMRPGTLRRYAEAAGFRRMEILPIENLFFRFYRLYA